MGRVFISGSADGLGRLAGEWLLERGHQVTFHTRSQKRADELKRKLPAASDVVTGDVATLSAMRAVADQVNRIGRHDALIHNVAIGYREPHRALTEDGILEIFAVNTLAPYLLTALIERPKRLVFLSSGLHSSGNPDVGDLQWETRRWNGMQAYSDTKLQDCWLAFGMARRWSDVLSNALEPGWVATRMGGPGAPDDLAKGAETQAWLAVSDDEAAKVSGGYFFHKKPKAVSPNARRTDLQDRLFDACRKLSGVDIV
jgi:NAD(P)-dependent dehydrogenase (short-subunit alcohol dehydrogenase family)